MDIARENLRRIIGGIIALLLLPLLFYLAAWQSPDSNARFASEAVALSVIGAIAVGIERIIEAFWAFWEWTGNARNPLGSLSSEYRRMVAELDEKLRPFSEEAVRMMQKAVKSIGLT